MMSITTLVTAPTIQPITTAEAKTFMRVDSGTIGDDLAPAQSIVPGDHVVAAAYSLEGAGVDVLGYTVLVLLNSGANGTGGTVDVKLQESDDDTTYTDVASGAFTQVTEANDNAIQEKEYTGEKQYLRTVATVATATCDFGVTIIREAPTGADDTLIDVLIESATLAAEQYMGRRIISQTWSQFFPAFPGKDYIELAYPPLVSVASTGVTYVDSDEDTNTFTQDGYYHVDTDTEPGRVTLDYGKSWPTFTPWPTNPVAVQFVCGYGTTRASVPKNIKLAIRYAVSHWYDHRDLEGRLPPVAVTLLANYRVEWF